MSLKIIGHRGARGLRPENTLASIQIALDLGVDEIEIDVRTTKDGVPVLSHNPRITDDKNKSYIVSDNTYRYLKKHRSDLTTLAECIAALDRQRPLYMDLKIGAQTELVIEVVQDFVKLGWSANDFLFGSREPHILRAMHEAFPDIPLIVIEDWSSLRAIRRAKALGITRISMLEYWLWPGAIYSLAHRGYQVYAFPPKDVWREHLLRYIRLTGHTNSPKRAQRWHRYGLCGIITDFPDRYLPKQ